MPDIFLTVTFISTIAEMSNYIANTVSQDLNLLVLEYIAIL